MDDILLVQLTGRMHFAAAKELESGGRLAALLTDFRVPKIFHRAASKWPILDNYCIDLPPNKLFGNPLVGLNYRARLRQLGHFNTATHILASQQLAKQAARLNNSIAFDTVYSFDIQALETFRSLKKRGKRLVLEQCVAPRPTQMETLLKLRDEYSFEMFTKRKTQLEILAQREKLEWSLADEIICPSSYVQRELVRFGADPSRISIVPYGFGEKVGQSPATGIHGSGKALKAIFVGTAEPRKGLTTLLSAMEGLGDKVSLDIYGDLSRIDNQKLEKKNIQIHGKVPFRQLQEAYSTADVFVLPSYLEGSATVVYEALNNGLPCVVTPETGSVVTDGLEGFVVPAGQPERIAECLIALASDPDLHRRMRSAALETASQYTVSSYGEKLCAAV